MKEPEGCLLQYQVTGKWYKGIIYCYIKYCQMGQYSTNIHSGILRLGNSIAQFKIQNAEKETCSLGQMFGYAEMQIKVGFPKEYFSRFQDSTVWQKSIQSSTIWQYLRQLLASLHTGDFYILEISFSKSKAIQGLPSIENGKMQPTLTDLSIRILPLNDMLTALAPQKAWP